MLTVNDIKTVIVEVLDINDGTKIEPVFEAYGYAKFLEFVGFYVDLASPDKVATVKGYAYGENGPVVVAQEFVGVNGQTKAFDFSDLEVMAHA
jgi:hypothetical protein